MSTRPAPADRPTILSTGMMWLVIITLVLAAIPLAGVLLAPAVIIYVVLIHKRGNQAHTAAVQLTGERYHLRSELDRLMGEAQRLGTMDHLQRERAKHQLEREISRLESEIQAGREVAEQEQARHAELLREKQARIEEEQARHAGLLREEQARIEQAQTEVVNLKEMADLNDYGLYNFENPADDSVLVKAELEAVKDQIKQMVRSKTAATGAKDWTVNNSKAKGKKMVNDMTKLLLRAFNSEVENSVKTVRVGHLAAAQKRVTKSAEQVHRLGTMLSIRIAPQYVRLRQKELELTHKHLEAVKAAKEEEREARARAREEAKAQKELLAAKAKQEKEVEHRRNVLAQLQGQGDSEEITKAAAVLAEAEAALEDVESTMANTRAGYVYVASNRGAFGPDVVKIGMTRRLNPEERIKELSDASVPFNFDPHAMIFSEDAWGLENALHKYFADKRVNLVNMRREYFYATPAEVREALLQHDVQLLEYHDEADSPEYLASEKLRTQTALAAE